MKVYLYVLIAIALAGAGLYVRHLAVKAAMVEPLEAKVAQGQHDLAALKAEVKRNQEISNAYQSDLSRLQAERDRPLTVRLCKPRPVAVPAASRATERPDDPSSGHVGREAAQDPGPDIGDQLLEFGIACEANALQLTRLQEWVRAR